MTPSKKIAFDPRWIMVAIADLLPTKPIGHLRSRMIYKRIAASIAEVGLVEPLVIFPANGQPHKYLILDGHVRWDVLKSLGAQEARCIIALDDEAFTYNKHVCQLTTVHGHQMILGAIQHGISEERIAQLLNVDVARIRRQANMLDGICPETVAILKDRPVSANVFRILRQMRPMRQIAAAEVMTASNKYSMAYAKMLLASSDPSQLLDVQRPRVVRAISAEQGAQMATEMENLHRQMKQIESSYGTDHLLLMLARGYVAKLLGNNRVVQYLSQKHPEILQEIQTVITAIAAENDAGAAGFS